MSLHASLEVGGYPIGEGVYITCVTPQDQIPPDGGECDYRVEVYFDNLPVRQFRIRHRYGDGELSLLTKALVENARREQLKHVH